MEPLLCFLGEDPRTPWVKARMSGYQPGNLDTATHIILPVPAFDRQGNIRGGPPLGEFTRCFRPGLTIFGGNLGPCLAPAAEAGTAAIDLLADESLTAANAAVTAEGAVGLAMAHLTITLAGAPVLVIGWGRIGKLLSRKLQALGARVTVSARRPQDLAMLQALGYATEITGNWKHLPDYRVIFNTVPAPVLEDTAATNPKCLLIELASAPGGITPTGRRTLLQAQGLPGKTAPETAGNLVAEAILRHLTEGGKI